MEQGITARGLTFQYRGQERPALQDVSFDIASGECVVLCGVSGCGKTTLTRILNGLAPSFFQGELTGSCDVFGLQAGRHPVEDYVPLAGSVFQNPKTQYFNTNTTAELAFPCENTGMPSAEIRARVQQCAEENGLTGLLDRSIFALSGGEKQRIAFGAACVLRPKLLVLDEPTGNLDSRAIESLGELIPRMKAAGVTIVLAEHRLAWTLGFADRYLLMENGQLRKDYSVREFSSLPDAELDALGLRTLDPDLVRAGLKEKEKSSAPDGTPRLSCGPLTVGYSKKHPVYTLPGLALYPGEVIALMGANGVGKSTLAKTLCGLLRPLSGSLCRGGRPAGMKELRKHAFLVMQDVNYQLFSDSVREEVLLGAAFPERCDEVLEKLDLADLSDRHPISLSGGQKQRAAIASALLSGRDLILMDEPTSGLDRRHMQQVGQQIAWLKEQGRTILIITHDEELAAGWCGRVIRMEAGNDRA